MDDRNTLLMTPGPTELPDSVRDAMSRPIQNPDMEPEFADYYRSLLEKLADVYQTDDDVLILGGEGILGLEASIASLIESGGEVLCLANGLYGEGFVDFVEVHGGNPTTHSIPFNEGFDVEPIKDLVETTDFAAATIVHCETPTGLLNDLDAVLSVLNDAGILTIVDAVSSLGGTPVPVDAIDVCLGASQKCFSSPPGLTTISISDDAWAKIESTPQNTFYTSLAPWHDIEPIEEDPTALPYTHLISNLYALEASLDRLLEAGLDAVYERHVEAAKYCRERGRKLELDPYPASSALSSPTVTAFQVDGNAEAIQQEMNEEHDVVVATSLGDFADDLIRIGHMGYNADIERVKQTMSALEAVLTA